MNPFHKLHSLREFEEYERIVSGSKERIKEFTEEHHRSFIFTIGDKIRIEFYHQNVPPQFYTQMYNQLRTSNDCTF